MEPVTTTLTIKLQWNTEAPPALVSYPIDVLTVDGELLRDMYVNGYYVRQSGRDGYSCRVEQVVAWAPSRTRQDFECLASSVGATIEVKVG